MAKYRVEVELTCLSDGEWGPRAIAFEFDTEADARSIVDMRFDSIRAAVMRSIGEREKLRPNPDDAPLAY